VIGSRKTEDRCWVTDVGRQKTDVGGLKTEVRWMSVIDYR